MNNPVRHLSLVQGEGLPPVFPWTERVARLQDGLETWDAPAVDAARSISAAICASQVEEREADPHPIVAERLTALAAGSLMLEDLYLLREAYLLVGRKVQEDTECRRVHMSGIARAIRRAESGRLVEG